MHSYEQDSHFRFILDYLHPIEGGVAGCIMSRILISNHIKPLTAYSWKSRRMHAYHQDSHFKSTLGHLLAINRRGAEWILISLISNPHQTSYILSMREQHNECLSAEFSFQMHLRPLTNYQ